MPQIESAQLDALPPVDCPCGQARRWLMDRPEVPFSLHLTSISRAAQPHHHQKTTEVYVVLECSDGAYLEVDQQQVPLQPKTAVLIPPGSVHRLVGQAEILLIAQPKFDTADEFLTLDDR